MADGFGVLIMVLKIYQKSDVQLKKDWFQRYFASCLSVDITFISSAWLHVYRQSLNLTNLQEAMVNDAYDVMQAMALSDEGRKRLSLKVEPFVIAIKEQLFGKLTWLQQHLFLAHCTNKIQTNYKNMNNRQ